MTVETWLYVGCYTTATTTAIHVFDASDPLGEPVARSRVDDIEHASFLALDAGRRTLYAVSESPERGSVVAYRRSPSDGMLTRLDEVPSHGADPCHLCVANDHVHVANYGSGTVASHLLRSDGGFGRVIATWQHEGSGPHPRQKGPHAHCVVASPDGSSVYAVDLGTDRIMRYVHDAPDDTVGMRLADETVMAPGSGPRHIALHPRRPLAYVVGELDNRLAVLDIDDTGRLRRRNGQAVSTLPADFGGDSLAAEVVVHPDGHRVYVSNRGHDSIATYAIDRSDGSPTLLGHVSSGGRSPRHFAIHPTGRSLLVANQDSDSLVSFSLDDDGVPRRGEPVATVSQPVCVVFVEVGS